MRLVLISAIVLAGAVISGGSARGQAFVDGSAAWTPQPSGFYKSVSVPGIGPIGPSVLMYFPSASSTASSPPAMGSSVAGVQYPVPGSYGSVILPGPTLGVPIPMAPASGGGLGLPTPPRFDVTPPPAVRPASTRRAAPGARATARAAAAEPAEPPPARPTLRERRGIR